MEDYTKACYNSICAEILEPTMRKIALSFCATVSDFYDTVHELSFSPDSFLAEEANDLGVDIYDETFSGYDRATETVKSKRRLYCLAARLRPNPDVKVNFDSNVLEMPKIYDERIYEIMISTYREIAEAVGDHLFNKLDEKKIVRALEIEGRGKLEKFSFSEFAMYVCLYMAINRSSVEVLNKAVETANQKKRLKGRLKRIKKWLFSDEIRISLIKTLLDITARINEEEYALLMEKHCRDYWLPDEKRHIRNLDRAMQQKYALTSPRVIWQSDGQDEGTEIDADLKNDKIWQNFVIENKQVQIYQEFFYSVVPVVELIAEGVLPRNLVLTKETIDENAEVLDVGPYFLKAERVGRITKEWIKRRMRGTYTISWSTYYVANEVYQAIDTYIDSIVKSVVIFLECLPEAEVAGNKTLLEYLTSL